MNKSKNKFLWVKKFLKSKIAVVLVIFGIALAGFSKPVSAGSNYIFSTVFQYYMLDNRADANQGQGKDDKVANMASLGSGGISGAFSYNDIVNSAPSSTKGSKTTAKKFVSMMATYSTFRYFSNKVQGFESIGSYVGRFLLMLTFMPLAIIMDIVNLLVPALIGILAKINFIPFIGNMLTNMKFASTMQTALGLSKAQVTSFINILLSISISFILISLWMALRHGNKNIDRKHWNKFKGRIFTIICVPIVVGLGATLINDIGNTTNKVPALKTTFASFLVDDRSWAYNYNFAPQGSSKDASDVNPGKGTFVDLGFDPYSAKGKTRIGDVNKSSSLVNNGSLFSNSTLLIAYGMSQSFSATDYINYKGSDESTSLYGGLAGTPYGSYKNYADSMGKKLVDVDKSYYGTGTLMGDKTSQNGSYKSAIDDYKTSKGNLNTSPQTAWRDRYIYGSKNAGALDKYYGDTPSQEMVQGSVGGTGNSTVPSDQSMFLILSTIFDETGGRYYINAPARGIKSVQGQFDSNRSDYYVVSMVGNPFFSVIGMITQPLITLVVLMALLVALFSVGILEMNMRPLSALAKALTLGDIEYCEAFLIYSGGIAGTLILFMAMPSFLVLVLQMISSLVVKAIPLANGMSPTTPQSSLAFNGTPLIVQGLVAIAIAMLWLKSIKFRNLMNELFTFIWSWAKSAGDRLEFQVNPNGSAMQAYSQQANEKNRILNAVNGSDNLKGFANNLLGKNNDVSPKEQIIDPNATSLNQDDQQSLDPNRDANSKPKSSNEIKRAGQYDRINHSLDDVQNNPSTSPDTVNRVLESQDGINKFKNKPTQQAFNNAQDRLQALKKQLENENAPQEQIDAVNKAINELGALGTNYKLDKNMPVKTKNVSDKTVSTKDGQPAKNQPGKQPVKSKNTDNKAGEKAVDEKQADKGTNSDNKVSDKPDSKVVKSKNTGRSELDNEKPNVRHHLEESTKKAVKKSNSHPVIDVTDKKVTESIVKDHTVKPIVKNNPKRIIKDNQLKGLVSSLNTATSNEKVARSIQQIRKSENASDVKRGIRSLQKSIKSLDSATKAKIKKDSLVKNLYDLQNKSKNK